MRILQYCNWHNILAISTTYWLLAQHIGYQQNILDIQCSCSCKVQTLKSRCKMPRQSRYAVVQGCSSLGMQQFRDAVVQACSSLGMQQFRDAVVQGCRSLGMQQSRHAVVQACSSLGMQQWSGWPCYRCHAGSGRGGRDGTASRKYVANPSNTLNSFFANILTNSTTTYSKLYCIFYLKVISSK